MHNNSLKLITLNIWGGHVEKPLLNFIQSKSDVDIFCLQEVYSNASVRITNEERYINLNIFSEIKNILPEHTGYFRPVVNGIYGIGMFIKNSVKVVNEGEALIYANDTYIGVGPTHSRILQYAKITYNGQDFTVVNVHGLWNGKGKTDTPERINQSIKITEFLNATTEPKILCGDFNLRPDTQSVKIIENGLDNHVRIHNVISTRTSFYTGTEKFADYIFTSPNMVVKNFKVLPDEISDHAPLLIEFSV